MGTPFDPVHFNKFVRRRSRFGVLRVAFRFAMGYNFLTAYEHEAVRFSYEKPSSIVIWMTILPWCANL